MKTQKSVSDKSFFNKELTIKVFNENLPLKQVLISSLVGRDPVLAIPNGPSPSNDWFTSITFFSLQVLATLFVCQPRLCPDDLPELPGKCSFNTFRT